MTPNQYKQLSIREFTKAAKIYETNHAGIYEICKDDYPPMLTELERDSFDNVLDVGCGTGPVIELLSKKYPEKHFVGLDITPAMIEVAQSKRLPNAEFIVGDAENLPFGDGASMRSYAPTASTTIPIRVPFCAKPIACYAPAASSFCATIRQTTLRFGS